MDENSFDWEVFFEIHKDNPREGPGDSASTAKAFSLMTERPSKPHILDIGCGPGAQTLDLARLTDGLIVAVDNHRPFLNSLQQKVLKNNLADRVRVEHGDMFALGFADKTFDIVWSEGAIYIIGFAKGLAEWRRFLKPGGYVAVTEITWLAPNPPAELRSFWDQAYSAMQDTEGNLAIVKNTGYSAVGHFTLPPSAWLDEYYRPIEEKLRILEQKYVGNQRALDVLATECLEIDLYRRYSDYYGYVFYIMRADG